MFVIENPTMSALGSFGRLFLKYFVRGSQGNVSLPLTGKTHLSRSLSLSLLFLLFFLEGDLRSTVEGWLCCGIQGKLSLSVAREWKREFWRRFTMTSLNFLFKFTSHYIIYP